MRLRLENIYRGGFEDIRLNNYEGKYINGLSLTHSIVKQLDANNVLGLWAFLTLSNSKLYTLAFS